MKSNLKIKLEQISKAVHQAEKMAAKRVKHALHTAEGFRETQMDHLKSVISQARKLKQTDIAKRAESVRKDLESRATEGLGIVLTKLNLTSKKDLDRLSKKVTMLQKRLDEIEKSSSK